MRTRTLRIARYAHAVIVACAVFAPLGSAAAQAPAPYRSSMRDTCEAELAKDKAWQAELRQSIRPDVHQEDAAILVRNKQHVIMAYGALWGLTVVFLLLLWLRQRRLLGEMDRLAKQIAKSAAE